MRYSRKGNKVTKILDGVSSDSKLNGYIMFNDNWISECDKTLYNEDSIPFSVLDFEEITEYYKGEKYSCVKLDKDVNIGDLLYTTCSLELRKWVR